MSALLDFSENLSIYFKKSENSIENIDLSSIIPFYNEDIWDMFLYSTSPKNEFKKIDFTLITEENIGYAKLIMALLLAFSRKDNGKLLAISTLIGSYYAQVIVSMSKYASENKISLLDIFISSKHLKDYIKIKIQSNILGHIQGLQQIIKIFHNIGENITGFKVCYDEKLLEEIRLFISARKVLKTQTAIIPTKLLSNATSARWEHIDKIYPKIDNLCAYLKKLMNNKQFGVADKTQPKLYKFYHKDVNDHALTDIFANYNIKGRLDFRNFIINIISTSKHLIHTYTGMRYSEALSLKRDCLKYDKQNKIFKIRGFTTKLHGTKYETEWITDKKIQKVIKILESICSTVNLKYKQENPYLFFSQDMILKTPSSEAILSAADYGKTPELYIESSILTIEESDLVQLETVSPETDWRNKDGFKIGDVWSFKSHQYRRSLAVYSLQSGLVSLGSLKSQLKHITREMSMYYANGSTNIILNQSINPIVSEFKTAKNELEALSYIKNVLFSDEKMYGAYGKLAESTKQNNTTDYKNYVLLNRQDTIKKIQKGAFRYKETPLGGCTHLEVCNSKLTRSLTSCFSCKSGILKNSKVENTIKMQERFISTLPIDSPEYKTESDELQLMKELKSKLIKENT